jgi:inosine/xanthosine triphosphatase
MGDDETRRGAENRVKNVIQTIKSNKQRVLPDFVVGMEGGVEKIGASLFCMAWMCVVETKNSTYTSVSKSASFQLPLKVVSLMKEKNMELGDADDVVFGRSDSKRKDGTVGILTKGDIDRSSYYEHALHMAMIPWRNPELYFNTTTTSTTTRTLTTTEAKE